MKIRKKLTNISEIILSRMTSVTTHSTGKRNEGAGIMKTEISSKYIQRGETGRTLDDCMRGMMRDRKIRGERKKRETTTKREGEE